MHWVRHFFLTSLLLLFSVCSFAGVLLEPYAGYGLNGKWEQGATTDSYEMSELGVKLAYQADVGFQIGVDIKLGLGEYKTQGSSSTRAVAGASGLHVGYQAPFGLRLYGSYYISPVVVFDDSVDSTYKGSGYKAGLGYSLWAERLAINIEYTALEYDELETVSGPVSLTNNLKSNNLMLVLSLPFHVK